MTPDDNKQNQWKRKLKF